MISYSCRSVDFICTTTGVGNANIICWFNRYIVDPANFQCMTLSFAKRIEMIQNLFAFYPIQRVPHPRQSPLNSAQIRGNLSSRDIQARIRLHSNLEPLDDAPEQIQSASLVDAHLDSSDDDLDSFTTPLGEIEVVDSSDAEIDLFGESTIGNFHFADSTVDSIDTSAGMVDLLGIRPEDILPMSFQEVKQATSKALDHLGIEHHETTYPQNRPQRAIFCNRTCNLRSISVVGFDLDYTLISYNVDRWEGMAYSFGLQCLRDMGVPTEGMKFDSSLVIRGLIMDIELGNLVKADRFGFIKRAMHGDRMLSPQEIKKSYNRDLVNLKSSRWQFLNTFFSVSEAVLFMQLVDRLDAGLIPHEVCPPSYAALHKLVEKALFRAHVDSSLKSDIIKNPHLFIEPDPEAAQTLLDLKRSGKQLLLITNNDWVYTLTMMSVAYDPYLPSGMVWRDLFDFIIFGARKPDFFSLKNPLYEIASPEGLLKPAFRLQSGGVYCGGSAALVEEALGVAADEIMYVGDHIYTDAAVAKMNFKWRTCLILRELEEEISALAVGREHKVALKDLLNKKEAIGDVFNQLRLDRQRTLYGKENPPTEELNESLGEILLLMQKLDEAIAPAVEADGKSFNARWGYLSRAGVNDRSQLMRQIEKNADLFTSRISNFQRYTPYCYFRSPYQSLPHDRPSADDRVLA